MKKISKAKIISTYASSLYLAAEETKHTDKVMSEVDILCQLLAEDEKIVASLANPIWSIDSKREAIKSIAKKIKLGKEMAEWLGIMAENSRIPELKGALDEFKHIYYRRHGVEEVEVLTVKALSAAQDKKLKTLLEKKLSKKVLINYTIKPELLGGLIVKYGSSMIDDSIAGKLTRLEIIMKGGQ